MAVESIQGDALVEWSELEALKGELLGRLAEVESDIDPRIQVIRLAILTYEHTKLFHPEKLPEFERRLVEIFFKEKEVVVVLPPVVVEECMILPYPVIEAPIIEEVVQLPPVVNEEVVEEESVSEQIFTEVVGEEIGEKIKQLRHEAAIYRKAAQTERELAASEAKKRILDPLNGIVDETVKKLQGIPIEDHSKKAAEYEKIAAELENAAAALQNT